MLSVGAWAQTSLQKQIDDAPNGATITLSADENLTSTVTIAKNITLDLNGHNITGTGARALQVTNGNVTITGTGTITSTGIADNSSVIRVGDNTSTYAPSLTIDENVTVTSACSYGVTIFGTNTSETLVVNGTVETTTVMASAISGNGSAGFCETTITIGEKANISAANDVAIYHPQAGTLTVNGTVSGLGGIEIKAGSLTVGENAKISATGTASHNANGDGTSTRGYAIAIVENNKYKGVSNINVNSSATITGSISTLVDSNKDGFNPTFDGIAMVAEIGDTKYSTLADAISAATGGQTITLLGDVALTSQVEITDKEIILDLNGKEISYSGGALSSGILLVHNGAGLTINATNGGTVNSGNSAYAAIALTKKNDNASNPAKLTVNGGNIIGHYYAIVGNGSRHNTEISITGGSFVGNEGTAVYHPQDGVLNISGGTFTGKETAIELRAGKLNITDGTFKSTATAFAEQGNGSGTTIVGAALAVSQHTTNKDIIVNISGGTFEGGKAIYEKDYQDVNTDNINISITGGTFKGDVYSQNVDEFISGGTFSSPIPEGYCAEGFKPTDDGNGHYGVIEKNYVAKIGDVKYESLAEAITAAKNGETVTLLADAKANAMIEISGKGITLDLNGKTISPVDGTKISGGLIGVHNGAGLTIDDSSAEKTGKITSGDSGKVYAAVQVTVKGDAATEPAKLIVNNGNLEGYYYAISGNGTRHNTEITINDGTFKGLANSPSTDDMGLAIFHPQDGKLTIKGGEFEGPAAGVEIRAGELNISGGTFTATATEFSCNANGNGTTTVGAALAIAQHTTKKDISVTISGGTFTGVKAINESNPQANDPTPQVTMAVTGGEFNGEVTTVDVNNFVSGGTFKNPVPEEYCAKGYIPEDNGDDTYGVKSGSYVAQIDDTKYESLSAAINAATAGQTVKLIADINETVENANANSVTINLNGKNWTSGSYTLKNDGGTITIEGEGTVKSTGSEGIAVWARTGSIIINSGNYENCSNEESTVYVGTTDANLAGKQPTITINGGSFKNTAEGVYKWNTNLLPLTLNIINNIANADSYQAIVVKGGEFYGNNPSIGDDSQLNKINNNSNFVSSELHAEMKEGVDGVFVIEEGGYVAQVGYIKYLTLDEAADASSTETITLLADATIETIDVVTGKTIDKNEHEITVNTFEVIDYEACNIPFDFKANTATYTRNVANNVWGTVCVPFTLKSCDSYTLYKVDGISNDVLEVSEVTDAVVPGTPVIFKAASAAESLTFSTEQANVKLDAPVASNGLIGTYSELTITEGLPSIYFINGDKFHQAQVSLTVPAYRAYIKNTTSGAKPRVLSLFVNEPDVTAIESVSSAATATAIYDASGRKLSTPQKGLNIVKLADGKTVKLLIK